MPFSLRFLIALLLALTAWAYWPATRGHFAIDDYVFIAQSRMVSAPWEAFWSNHFYEPVYFRPIGITLWWVATKLFGEDYAWHSVINLVVHGVNVVLVAALTYRLTLRVSGAVAAAALFALLPFTFGATLWPSNRFDLLTVLFCLLMTSVALRFLDEGKPLQWIAAGLFALAACWSKELAYPIIASIAFALCFVTRVPWQRRFVLFAMLGCVSVAAFVWRHFVLPLPYAAASQGTSLAQLANGFRVWFDSLAAVAHANAMWDSVTTVVLWLLALVIIAALIALLSSVFGRRSDSGDAEAQPSSIAVVAAGALVFMASLLPQLPLIAVFSFMLGTDPLGSATFTRFYYAPTAPIAMVLGVLIARTVFYRSMATITVIAVTVLALQMRSTAAQKADWINREIRPISVAATQIVDALSEASVSTSAAPCVVVFLGTQSKHTWFRMFSDVTVKALTTKPDTTWRCQILTESTPWIFISPAEIPLADLGLPIVPIDANKTPKPDYAWGGVRYRYRHAPSELAKLPHARFYEWKNGEFVEVTDAVKSGAREVKSHGWGF